MCPAASVSAAMTLPPPFSLMMFGLTFNNSYLPHMFDGNEGNVSEAVLQTLFSVSDWYLM